MPESLSTSPGSAADFPDQSLGRRTDACAREAGCTASLSSLSSLSSQQAMRASIGVAPPPHGADCTLQF
jgi:hypothetical protein